MHQHSGGDDVYRVQQSESGVDGDANPTTGAHGGDNMIDERHLVPGERLAPYRRRRTLPYVAAAIAAAIIVGIGVAAYVTDTKGSDRSGDLPPRPAPPASCGGPMIRKVAATLLSTTINASLYRFPVESRQYPGRWPGLLFVSQRYGGGIVVLDTRGAKETAPVVIGHWTPPTAAHLHNVSVEGQDMHGDIFVVCGMGGGLYILNASDPTRLSEMAFLPNLTSPNGAAGPLHVKLYVPTAHPDRLFAILSMGWVNAWPSNASTNYLLAVDVTNPARPRKVATIATPVRCMESVTVVGDAAYVGGFCSTTFAAVNLGGLVDIPAPQLTLGGAMVDPSYVEMVSALIRPPPGCAAQGPIIVSALWASPGGIATFNASSAFPSPRGGGGNATVVPMAVAVSPLSSFANRVDFHRATGLVLTPLEHGASTQDHDGGFALYDVRDPAAPRLLHSQRLSSASQPTRTYCAAFAPSGAVAYVWGVDDHSLRVYRLTMVT